MLSNGVKPSKTDLRDYTVKAGAVNANSFKLNNLPKVKNQSMVNSCVAHSVSSVLEWFNQKETGEYRELSTAFIYGMQGVEFNRLDTRMYLRDACKIMQKYGDCLNDTVSFNIEMPHCYNRLKKILNDEVYKEAAICKIKSYVRCTTDNAVKYALMRYSPVIIAVKWYKEYEVLNDGTIHFNTSSSNGHHAVMVYGFNEKGWLCQNSFGVNWGHNGRFILPYNYGFEEAWSFIDDKNSDVHKPKQNKVLNVAYKAAGFVVDLIKNNR
jgi:C1A family cysteine protease